MLRQMLTLLALLTGLAGIAPGQDARAAERQTSGIEAPAAAINDAQMSEQRHGNVDLADQRPVAAGAAIRVDSGIIAAPRTVMLRIDRAHE